MLLTNIQLDLTARGLIMKQLTRLRRGSDSSTKSNPLDTPENDWEKDVVPKDENPLFYFARRLASQSTAPYVAGASHFNQSS